MGLTKAEARALAYRRLHEQGAARFPFPIEGRIPHFRGAEAAAERLRALEVYQRADALKVNPDAAQQAVRVMALRDGKTLYLATPRLRGGFRRIRREDVPDGEEAAAARLTTRDAYGTLVPVESLRVDLVVVGSVAVAPDGSRAGKGEGAGRREPEPRQFRSPGRVEAVRDAPAAAGEAGGWKPEAEGAQRREATWATRRPDGGEPSGRGARTEEAEDPADLEYALLRELGHPDVPVATTVHPAQIVPTLPHDPHDMPVDWIVTPERAIESSTPHPKPHGIDWALLGDRDVDEMPVLAALRRLRWERQTLPDLLAPGMAVVFVGVNPGRTSAGTGRHFAGPNTYFWRLLHEAGFTPRRWTADEDEGLPGLGVGLTCVVERPTRGEQDLAWPELVAGGRSLRERIAAYRPSLVALLGKQTYRAYAGLPPSAPVVWGLQERQTVPGVREFAATNPSPRSTVPYAERLAHFSEIRRLTMPS